MISSKAQLLETLSAIQGVHLLVVGDLILDRYIWGAVDRISPEAPVPIVEVSRSEDRLGGAGNVATNLKGIGAKVSVCGLVGDDEEGQIMLAQLAKIGIDKDGVIIDRERPTALKTRVIAQAQQIVRIDRERRTSSSTALQQGFAAVVEAHLEDSKAVIISDYGKGAIAEAVLAKLEQAHTQKKIGLGIRPLVVDPHPVNFENYRHITIPKPNRKEAEVASGVKITDRESALKAAEILLNKWKASMVVITLGEDGMLVYLGSKHKPFFLETVAREVFDVSGAGDTVTALVGAAIAAGASPEVAGDLANIAAGVVVSEVGTVAINHERLRNKIESLDSK